jgi:prepilin-type N-terminal cleavage/methylation domain-containing protein
MRKKGFTLIELLVVIAIIGLLATMAVVALGNSRSRARDARRLSDIRQMQTALQLYYHEQGGYPTTIGTSIASGTSVYMALVPSAPLPFETGCTSAQNSYVYSSPTTDTYTLTYCIGNKTGDIPAGPATATPAGLKN